MHHTLLQMLADALLLGDCLRTLFFLFPTYELRAHWLQGEFHHDLVLFVPDASPRLPGSWLVVSTNCNGGVKEILCLSQEPDRWGLWHHRCPDNAEFSGPPLDILATSRTVHWFDPCALLTTDARSELLPEHRRRQRGGGWQMRGSNDTK